MIYKLHAGFYEKLKAIDPYLDARFDMGQMAILVSAKRPGRPQVYEATFHVHAENQDGVVIRHTTIDDLQDYAIRRLREMDVWARFGSGKAYDDHLAAEEEKDTATKKKEFRAKRLAIMKEQRQLWQSAIEHAKKGLFTKEAVEGHSKGKVSTGAV